jgi:hypothetical protein
LEGDDERATKGHAGVLLVCDHQLDGLSFVVESPFALDAFALGDDTTGTVSFVDSAAMLGGATVSGRWTIESCAILDRWDRLVANTDAPKTVLVRSTLDAIVGRARPT